MKRTLMIALGSLASLLLINPVGAENPRQV
ncbi:MAG: pentapeptide repeat-containing protein, partial [Microcystis panniformis]